MMPVVAASSKKRVPMLYPILSVHQRTRSCGMLKMRKKSTAPAKLPCMQRSTATETAMTRSVE